MKYVIHKAKDGSYYFTQVAANGETVTTSETYTTKADALRGAHDAYTDGQDAGFVDETGE